MALALLVALFATAAAAGPSAPSGLAPAAAPAPPAPAPPPGPSLAELESRTTVHVLANGWTFVLVRRPSVPVFSFCTVANVGSAQEVTGMTGLAHMMEHMAFKGSHHIGTRDPAGEQAAMTALEDAYQGYQRERLAPHPDAAKVATLLTGVGQRRGEAEHFVVKNELDDILARAGAVDVNADTGADQTEYYYSLPANQIELWAFVESERFGNPVFREFYEERDVVEEERRMRIDGEPQGRLTELLVATAFEAHPYHHPTIGWMSDLESITRTEGETFFRDQYVPANLVTAIVGDLDPATLVPLLDRYFGRLPGRPKPPPLHTVEPPQAAAKSVTLEDPAQPQVLVAYHRPAVTDPDDAAYEAIDDILTGGRTSRLYRSLVRDSQLAIEVSSFSGLPGEKYPNLWTVSVEAAPGATTSRIVAAIDLELNRLKREDVSDAELAKFRARARADLLRSLGSNQGLATAVAQYQTLYGDWREIFREIDRFDHISKADIRRVASAAFRPANRTVASLVTRAPSDSPDAGATGTAGAAGAAEAADPTDLAGPADPADNDKPAAPPPGRWLR